VVKSKEMGALVPGSLVVPNGIDLETFAPQSRAAARAKLGLDPDGTYLLFGARPDHPVKNYPLARDAHERLRAGVPAAELLVVHGRPHAEMPYWFNAVDVVFFPSLHEGSSNFLKEAAACNAAIVTAPVGDAEELLAGVPGARVVDHDPARFAAAAEDLLDSSEEVATRQAVSHLDAPVVAAQVRDIYDAVLRGPGPA
jgi:glycosyltransferase involved in cell wall biosynthesis